MIKETLKIILKEFYDGTIPELIERDHKIDLSILDSPVHKIITIVGPRRAGKTYLLYQTMKKLLAHGADITDIAYINFEDERILPVRPEELQQILDAYFELYPKKNKPYIFFDEIQNIIGWHQFVRRLNDRGFNIFLTGSNSRMLGHDIATALRGRTLTYEIFPFSFREFLVAHEVATGENALYGEMRHRIIQLYEEYLFSGGYPELAFIQEHATKGKIVQDYFNTVFYRDLAERYRIKNSELLRQWLNILIANIASTISYHKVENDFKSRGMKLSRATLSTYARYVEDIFFGFFVELYSESARKRQINPKKFYIIDQGLHNYLTLKFSENRGRLLENIVFLELRRRGFHVFYHKTVAGHEVDFLIKDDGGWKLIQVCHDLSHIETFTREKKALISGLRELNLRSGIIVTHDEKREERIDGYTIKIVPAWEWLLVPKI
jgi:predicted AAA+ superfamily ATPase